MTASDYRKVLKQIDHKPSKLSRFKKYNTPKTRTGGDLQKKCRICGRTGGHIGKYKLNVCRQCFREIALQIKFKKYS